MNRELKTELVFAWLYLAAGVASIIATSIIWTKFDNGFIRYGIILPVFFLWQAWRGFKKYRELKVYYDANAITGNKAHS